jgi:hypothetical protein
MRLAILERCLYFIVKYSEKKKRWVVGAAGVGKSAIMQSVGGHPFASKPLRSSFLSMGAVIGSKPS